MASLRRSSALLAGGTVFSRVLGFVSALLLTNTIGISGQGADAFALANQLPNNIYLIVAAGTISAIVVPQLTKAASRDADGGVAFRNRLVTLALALFVLVTLAVTLAAPLLVRLYAQRGDGGGDGHGFTPAQFALTNAFAYWCLPQVLFYAIYAIVGAVLNAQGRFAAYAWAPIANNVVMIGVLVLFRAVHGAQGGAAAEDWDPGMIALLAGGATLGIVVQAVVVILAWRRAGLAFRPDFRWRNAGLGSASRGAFWTFAMILVSQTAGIVQVNIASIASEHGVASIATMNAMWLVFMLPYSVITVSIAVPYYTRMSAAAATGDRAAIGADLQRMMQTILLLLVFCMVGLAVISPSLVTLFDGRDPWAPAAGVLCAFLVGLLPSNLIYLAQRGFYALGDTRTPFLTQLVQAAVFVALAIWAATAPHDRIALLVALALAAAMWAQAAVGLAVARRRFPGFRVLPIAGRTLWYLLAMLPAAAAGIGVTAALGGVREGAFPIAGFITAAATCVIVGVVMAAVYAAVLWLTRSPELRALLDPLRGRLIRSVK